jgi:hypothetical protein
MRLSAALFRITQPPLSAIPTAKVADEAIHRQHGQATFAIHPIFAIFDLNSILEKDRATAAHGQGTNKLPELG